MAAQSVQALRERRNTLAKEVRDVLDKNPGGEWKPEHQKTYDDKTSEMERIDGEIAREQKLMDLTTEKKLKDLGVGAGGEDIDLDDPKVANKVRLAKWLRGGDNALTPDDWETQRETMRNTLSGDPANGSQGGYTVQTEVAEELIRAMKAYGGMYDVATQFSTSQGNPMNWPTSDDTSNTGELIAENTTATALDPAFGTVGLNTYKFSSKIVAVPFELLQDSEIDIEGLVRELLAERLGRITNTFFTTGTGTAQPRGIVTGATLGKTGTTGQTLSVIYDDLVDMEHSIDPAYRKLGCGWMMNDASLKVIRKIKDSQNRPIFVPGYETGIPGAAGGTPSQIFNYPITVNQDVAVMAANAKSILFGRLKNYRIRNVMAAQLFRFADSAYIKLGQIGFLAWMRAGGNLIDVSGTTVKYYANSAT